VQNLSQDNEFDLHENEIVGRTHFHMNGFAQTLFLIQCQKWPVALGHYFFLWEGRQFKPLFPDPPLQEIQLSFIFFSVICWLI